MNVTDSVAYEALLAKSPQARKRTGSYYTPPDLVEVLLDSVLEPLLDAAGDPLAITIIDPACGTGNFLTAAARRIARRCPDPEDLSLVVRRCLYGVDRDETALALCRSALQALSGGDPGDHLKAADAILGEIPLGGLFPALPRGFDALIANPPWERLKLQEREWFLERSSPIADEPNAARRQRMIAALRHEDPRLHEAFACAKAMAEARSREARTSGRYPLAGRGDVNAYALFAEMALGALAPGGRAGLIVPSGIASDRTTRHLFGKWMETGALERLIDFENRKRQFPDVDSRFKFCLLTLTARPTGEPTEFRFFAQGPDDLADPERRIALSAPDLARMNPLTKTCPIFRTRTDAAITRAIYERVPILGEEIPFQRMFDMTNDAGRFHSEPGPDRLPLLEAKHVHHFDHRWGEPRYWVDAGEVPDQGWPAFLGYRLIARSTDERTCIAALFPPQGVGNSLALIQPPNATAPQLAALVANLSSFVLDYVARQKVASANLNFFVMRQLPVLPFAACESKPDLVAKVVELVFTSPAMAPFARACGYDGPMFTTNAERRADLRAELDAGFFHAYGLSLEEAAYVMDTFPITRRKDVARYGSFRTKEAILAKLADQYP